MSARIGRTSSRTLRRIAGRPAAVLLLAALAVTGCGGSKDDTPGASSSPKPDKSAKSATVHAPKDCAAVAQGATPEELAVAVSAQLFDASPVVVVAPMTDGAEIRAGADQAKRLGAPLLVDSAVGGTAVSAPAAPDADSTASPEKCDDEADEATATPTATGAPSDSPSDEPSAEPSAEPSDEASESPSEEPSESASEEPSATPSASPSAAPSVSTASLECVSPTFDLPAATATPTASPTGSPTGSPTATPTATETPDAEETPGESPSAEETESPSAEETESPSATETPSATGTPSAAPTPVAPADRPLVREIQRLDPDAVLAMSPEVAADLRAALPDVKVVTDAGDLPRTTTPAPLEGLTVFVNASPGAAHVASIATAATGEAAGARVIGVDGTDPRADGCAIEALAAEHPTHLLGAGGGFGPADDLAERVAAASTGIQLPGGGQLFFPGRRLIALYGHPGAGELGALGQQGLDAAIARASRVAEPYRDLSDVPVVPTFEIIATVAQGAPGGDGDYSAEAAVDDLRPWVEKAGAAGMYVVLDLQPGRSNALAQAKIYEELLKLPYVGLAIDPEWKLGPGQVPLRQIGGIDAWEINQVADWLADLTAENNLPQKLLVLHQFKLSMIRDRDSVDTSHDELAVLVHMDGQGEPSGKDGTWRIVTENLPGRMWLGWKNFYTKDTRTLSAAETMTKKPTPVMISYQ